MTLAVLWKYVSPTEKHAECSFFRVNKYGPLLYEVAIIMKSVMPTFGICQVRVLQQVWLSYH